MAVINLPARFTALAFALVLVQALGPCARPATAAPTPPAPAPQPRPSATILYGGGAALPAFALGSADGDPHSIFGYFSHVSRGYRVSYCATGSGFGTAVFVGTIAASGACAGRDGSPAGFGAANDFPDFVVTDTPLGAANARVWNRNAAAKANPIAGRGEPVQVPVLAGTVAIAYRNPDVGDRLNLGIDTLCRIADGEIVDWNQIPLDPANPSGAKYPARRLRFVYRSDRSGLTFSLANFLSARDAHGNRRTCVRPGETYALNDVFDARDAAEGPQSPAGVLPVPLPRGAATTAFVGARGDAAAIACIEGTGAACRGSGRLPAPVEPGDGTIGYTSGAAATAAALLHPALRIAALYTVEDGIPHAYDPVLDLPDAATLFKSYVTGSVVGEYRPNGRPEPEYVSLPPSKIGPCVALVPPDRYAFPEAGYPIVAIVDFNLRAPETARARPRCAGSRPSPTTAAS